MATKDTKDDFKHIVRIANTDLRGEKSLGIGLKGIKGVGFSFSHAICVALGLDEKQKIGYLSNDAIEKLNDLLNDPTKYNIPSWMYNRRKDIETGKDIHLLGANLGYIISNTIKAMMKLKIYRGVRHSLRLPVRGQNTKSNFRKSKVKNAAKRKAGRK